MTSIGFRSAVDRVSLVVEAHRVAWARLCAALTAQPDPRVTSEANQEFVEALADEERSARYRLFDIVPRSQADLSICVQHYEIVLKELAAERFFIADTFPRAAELFPQGKNARARRQVGHFQHHAGGREPPVRGITQSG